MDISDRYNLAIIILKPNKTKEEQDWSVNADFQNVASLYYNGNQKKLEKNLLIVMKPRIFFEI